MEPALSAEQASPVVDITGLKRNAILRQGDDPRYDYIVSSIHWAGGTMVILAQTPRGTGPFGEELED